MTPLATLAYALVFPGVLFAVAAALGAEWLDRKLVARAQSRMGPPLSQTLADFVKLLAKEDVAPRGVPASAHVALPLLALAAGVTAFALAPVGLAALPFAFPGDLVLALFLLTVPSLLLFLAGWTTGNPFARVGAERVLAQTFSYEVPFFLACLGPALAAGSWAFADVEAAQATSWWFALTQPIGFLLALLALQAKLERSPFDAPHADTEIAGGPMIDMSGASLAFWRLAADVGLVAGALVVADLFLGGGALPGLARPPPALAVLVVGAKTAAIVAALSLASAAFSRLRMDQLSGAAWRLLAPVAVLNVALVIAFRAGGA